ncbi:MAG: pectate lyase [Balneolaceae bacterium]
MQSMYFATVCFLLILLMPLNSGAQTGEPTNEVEQAMLKASRFMVEEVSTNGGYLRLYLPDFSRRWGELEAFDTQIWTQGSTPEMGQVFLDAYEATGEEYYYHAAEKVAQALIWGQQPSGGWHYIVDFAGDRSLKRWHQTIGRNAWGFEEYYHYYGNATLDDDVTTGAARFLLRIYLQKLDSAYKPALEKAIDFILKSQYSLGGWPQRYPLMYEFSKDGKSDYTSFYTFNDNVISGAIDFLIRCYQALGQERLLDPIRRGMNFYLLTQQGDPQPGWAQQYDRNLKPAHARSYEPPAISTGTTYEHVLMMLRFYRYTGDRRYLSRLPDAIDWLEKVTLPEDARDRDRRTHAYFMEIGTDKPLYSHRTGTGVTDGEYWIDYSDEIAYGFGYNTHLDISRLRDEYERMSSIPREEVVQNSPFQEKEFQGERNPLSFYIVEEEDASTVPQEAEVRKILDAQDEEGRWLTQHEWISDSHTVSDTGVPSNTALHSEERTAAGIVDPSNQQYISTSEYMKNMNLLISYIKQ